jgi:Transglutaminase-like superfamily
MLSELRHPRRDLQQWGTLSACEKRLLLQSIFLLPLIKVGLHLFSFSKLVQMLDIGRATVTAAQDPRRTTKRVVKMVAIAANHGFVDANCLPRSLAAHYLLRSQGVASEVRVGGANRKSQFEAHAWIECAGEAFDVTGNDLDEFAPFDAPVAGRSR